MDWSPDRHLRRRMALTLLALAALTVAFATGVAALLAWGIEWLSGLFDLGVPLEIRLVLGGVVTLIAGIVILRRALRKDAAETFDAEAIDPEAYPDLYATVLDAAGVPVPDGQGVDGESLRALLRRSDGGLDRDALFWHYPHYGNQGGTPAAAVRTESGTVSYSFSGRVRSIWTSAPCFSRRRSARNAPNSVPASSAARPNRRTTAVSWLRQTFRRLVRASRE